MPVNPCVSNGVCSEPGAQIAEKPFCPFLLDWRERDAGLLTNECRGSREAAGKLRLVVVQGKPRQPVEGQIDVAAKIERGGQRQAGHQGMPGAVIVGLIEPDEPQLRVCPRDALQIVEPAPDRHAAFESLAGGFEIALLDIHQRQEAERVGDALVKLQILVGRQAALCQ